MNTVTKQTVNGGLSTCQQIFLSQAVAEGPARERNYDMKVQARRLRITTKPAVIVSRNSMIIPHSLRVGMADGMADGEVPLAKGNPVKSEISGFVASVIVTVIHPPPYT